MSLLIFSYVFIFIQAPDGRGIYKDKVGEDSYETLKHKIDLNEVGDYEIRITNNFETYKVLAISMMLSKCHTIPHNLKSKNINVLMNKLEKAGQSQVDSVMKMIKSKDNSYYHLLTNLKK